MRAGQHVGFDVDRAAGSTLNSLLRLFDASGRQIATNDDAAAPGEIKGSDSFLSFTFNTAGTFYIGVSNNQNKAYNPLAGVATTAPGARARTGSRWSTCREIRRRGSAEARRALLTARRPVASRRTPGQPRRPSRQSPVEPHCAVGLKCPHERTAPPADRRLNWRARRAGAISDRIDGLNERELIDLNRRIVERLRMLQQLRAHRNMLQFSVGQRVRFRTDSRTIEGTLTRYNRKTVTVLTDAGEHWNVAPSLLEPG